MLPSRDRVTNALSDAADTGKSFGIVYTGLPVGGALAPVLVGRVVAAADQTAGFAVVAGFFLAASLVVLAVSRVR